MAAGDRDVCRGVSGDIGAGSGVGVRDGHLPGRVCGGDLHSSQIRGYLPPEPGSRCRKPKQGYNGSSNRKVGL